MSCSSSSPSASPAEIPSLNIPFQTVFVMTMSQTMLQAYHFSLFLYERAKYVRHVLFQELRSHPFLRSKFGANNSPVSSLGDVSFSYRPYPPLHLCVRQFLLDHKVYECAHVLIEEIMVPSIRKNNEVNHGAILMILRASCYSADLLFSGLNDVPLADRLLRSLFQYTIQLKSFGEMEHLFASIAAILSPAHLFPSSLTLYLGERITDFRGLGYYKGSPWVLLTLDQERQLLIWMFQLIFRTLKKQTFALQLTSIYHYMGTICLVEATGVYDSLLPLFVSLLHTVHERALYSGEMNIRRDSNEPIVQFTLNDMNLVLQTPNAQSSNLFLQRDRQEWSSFLHHKWWLLQTDNDGLFRAGGRTDEKVGEEEESLDPPLSSLESFVSEVYLFTYTDASKGKILMISMPYVLMRRKHPRYSPFEFLKMEGSELQKHTITFLIEAMVRMFGEDPVLLREKMSVFFQRMLSPLRWMHHAAARLFSMLTSQLEWWPVIHVGITTDVIIDTWCQWFQACAYNLKTLSSEKLTEMQKKVIRACSLSSDQKKRMVRSMITSMEIHTHYLFEPIEMYEFKHLLSLFLFSVARNEVGFIRMYFSMVVERFVQLVTLNLYEEMDLFSTSPHDNDELYLQSYNACLQNPPVAETFPLLSEKARRILGAVDVPDWTESGKEEEEEEFRRQVASVRSRPLSGRDLPTEQQQGLRQVAGFVRKYSSQQDRPFYADTLLYRFLLGFSNSTCFRAVLELTTRSHPPTSVPGVLYFLLWQPAVLEMLRPFQVQWILRKCARHPTEFFNALKQRLHLQYGECPFLYDRVLYQRFMKMARCKLKDAQLRAIQSFVDAYPSFLELHHVTDEQKLQSLFQNRYPTTDCIICFDYINLQKSVGILTGCGHFLCVSCALRAFFNREDNRRIGVEVECKSRETTVCPKCRTSVNSPQPELPACFGNFQLVEGLTRGNDHWMLSRGISRACVLPCLYILDFSRQTAEVIPQPSRKRRRTSPE